MHLHFLGICGTFMGSLALLAREMGHKVTGPLLETPCLAGTRPWSMC
jgi:UDP-N-acetylmuramate-alanine ligase